jgi:signal peptidase I
MCKSGGKAMREVSGGGRVAVEPKLSGIDKFLLRSTSLNGMSAEETSRHRIWRNILCSILLPGSGHFLSGRKRAGVIWFLASAVAWLIVVFAYGSPYHISIAVGSIACVVPLIVRLWTVIDSCRKPIPRLKIQWWLLFGALVVAIQIGPGLIVRRWFLQPFSMPTAGMTPTLMGNRKSADGEMLEGDHITVDKWTYHLRPPARGDVLVFKTEGIRELERERFGIPLREFYVKRLVGLPGERVSVHLSDIYINGQKLLDPHIVDHISVNTNGDEALLNRSFPEREVHLGPEEYFVLGDNISNSLDSRYYGAIKRESILGKVAWIFWPVERRRFVE